MVVVCKYLLRGFFIVFFALTFIESIHARSNTVPKLLSISISPAKQSIALGKSLQYSAIASYSNGLKKNVSKTVQWKLISPSVKTPLATISATGLVKTKGQGNVSITATLMGKGARASPLTITAPVLSSLALSPLKTTVVAGKNQQYTVLATYSDGTKKIISTAIKWSASSKTVLDNISNSGLAKTKAQGSVIITASLSGQSAQATLIVSAPTLNAINISLAQTNMEQDQQQQLRAIGIYSNGSKDITQEVNWSTSNKTIASVDSKGRVNSLSPGVINISASLNKITSQINLTVVEPKNSVVIPKLESIKIEEPTSITVGQNTKLIVKGKYANEWKIIDNNQITWIVNPKKAVVFNEDGSITPQTDGNVDITASIDGKSAQIKITVTDNLSKIYFTNGESLSLNFGEEKQLIVQGNYSSGAKELDSNTLRWESSKTGVVEVDPSSGKVTTKGAGETEITASLGDIKAQIKIIVNDQLQKLIINNEDGSPFENDSSILVGKSIKLIVQGNYVSGETTTIDSNQINWHSNKPGAIKFNQDGTTTVLTAENAGKVDISASFNGVKKTITLNITDPVIESITIQEQNSTIAAGQTQQFTIKALYSNNEEHKLKQAEIAEKIDWTSDNTDIANIDQNGLATSKTPGSATISAQLKENYKIDSNAPLTIGEAIPISIKLSQITTQEDGSISQVLPLQEGDTINLPAGKTTRLQVEALYSDNSQRILESNEINWTSNNDALATVNDGLITTQKEGLVDINLALNQDPTITGHIRLNIEPAVLDSIKITPEDNTIFVGDSISYTAIGHYTDGTELDISEKVTWTSTNENVIINEKGIINNAPEGATTISAEDSNGLQSNEASLSVIPISKGLQSISITPEKASIITEGRIQYKAMGHYEDDTDKDISAAVTWSSSDESIAVIDEKGLANGIKIGDTQIKASINGDGPNAINGQLMSNIAKLSVQSSAISAPGALHLYPAKPSTIPTPTLLTIRNDSNNTVNNIHAALPPDTWGDVNQDASACQELKAGKSCQLKFTPSETLHDNSRITIESEDAAPIYVNMAVSYPWITNKTVYTIEPALANNRIYLGGDFTYVGPNTGSSAPIETSSTIRSNFPRINGQVFSIIADGAGGWYIGGNFTKVGGFQRNNLAHITKEYQLDESFNPNINGIVQTLALSNSILYIGGNFSQAGSSDRANIAAFDLTTGLPTNWVPLINGTISTIIVNNSNIYVGGKFTTINGEDNSNLVILDASTGIVNPTFQPSPDGVVNSMLINGSTLYVGGLSNPLIFERLKNQSKTLFSAASYQNFASAYLVLPE